MKDFKFKEGDKVVISIDVDNELSCAGCEDNDIHSGDVPELWQYFCDNNVFTIDRIDNKLRMGREVQMYWLKELPNMVFYGSELDYCI